ncbi:MAG: molybdopterin-dependent oxidoreductase [Treponema sp.]|jgi:CO/xanthine dehydrogenase Mo-binding subunit|nr:molybdopterin-dependent oxidoreductase [Treponema sp.]
MEEPVFIDDLIIPGALTGVILRSPAAAGILTGIDTPKLPGGVTLIRAQDIPGENRIGGFGPGGGELPVLADGRVSYIGEAAALLAGPDKAKLKELAEQCVVRIEAEEPVLELREAENAFARRNYTLGDIEGAFENHGGLRIIEGRYYTSFQDPWPTDPAGAAALPLKSGEKTLYEIHTATQWPFHVQRAAAGVLGVSPQAVRVRQSRLEIHLDSRLWFPSLCACHAALAARITGKPVKIVLSREEDFRFAPKRAETEIILKSALEKRGRIVGTRVRVRTNMGARGIFAAEMLDRICLGALGAYYHGSAAVDARALESNLPPSGPLSGLGLAQGFFAMERHASCIADSLRMDPAEWRKNLFLHKGRKLAIGAEIRDNVSLEGLLDAVSSMSDYNRKWASYELLRRSPPGNPLKQGENLRGIGISSAWQGSGFLYPPKPSRQGVELTLEKDGSLEIRTSMTPPFGERVFPWKAIAARELGIREEQVRIVSEAADLPVPDSGPACLSRKIAHITELVERGCAAIKKRHFRNPLPITVYRSYQSGRGPAWEGEETYDENALSFLSWAGAVVEVEIDPVEYIPRVRGIWMALDGGQILAEDRARRRLTELIIQSLNWAAREEVQYREGKIPDSLMRNYPLINMEEIPPIKIDFIWPEGGYPKGIGELPANTIPAAYVQALSQALDYPFCKIPVTPADIWIAVQNLDKAGEQEGF